MKKVVYIFCLIIILLLIIVLFLFSTNRMPIKKQLKQLDLDNFNKVMFVAHPDDDTIWGGAHLLDDDYLVVCVTCGVNGIRVREINNALNYSNDRLITLGYPDKVFGKRSDWKSEKKSIEKDIKEILSYKNWDLVVTHNPNGEYGHSHHKMTSKIVTDIYGKEDTLYYFGKYYNKSNINKLDKDSMINSKILKSKKKMLDMYKSQGFIDSKFGHMYPYENWIRSTNW